MPFMNTRNPRVLSPTQRNLRAHIYCCTVHKSQDMEPVQCPSTNVWIKSNVAPKYTMEYYSAIQKKS